MRLTKYLLNEKFTKKEIKDVFNNENIWVGAEFEFICYNLEIHAGNSDEIQSQYRDAYSDWEEYHEERERLENEISDLKDNLGDLKDEKTDLDSDLIDLENEDDRDEDKISDLEDKISELEDKISDVESDLDSSEYELERHEIGRYYIRYMEEYLGGYDSIDLPEPPDPDEIEILSPLEDEQEWKYIAEDVLPPIIQDASWIKDYEIGGYGDVDQEKGDSTWAFEYDSSVSSGGGVEMKSPPIRLPDFIEILPDILDWIDDNGYGNPSTGLHFHMSIDGVNNIQLNLDMVKLILFLEEDFIWKVFPERVMNSYTREVKEKVLSGMKSTNVSSYISDLMGNKSVDPDSISGILGDHYDAVHKVGRTKGTHVEFRHPGGKNYQRKLKEIKNLIARYALTLSLAVDPNYKKKEYIQKIIRILNKIEWYRLNKKIDAYDFLLQTDSKKEALSHLKIPELSDAKFNVLKSIFKKRKKRIEREMNSLGVKLTHKEKMVIGEKIDSQIVVLEEKNYIWSMLRKM